MTPLRFLFQAHNRRGLGHLMRGMNIATELKKLEPAAKILFYSKSPTARKLCGDRFKTYIETDKQGLSHWPEVIESFRPHIIVYDTVLPKDGDAYSAPPHIRQIYIMRKTKPERQNEILHHPLMGQISRIVIPHTPEEFGDTLPVDLEKKTTFVGPIIRKSREEERTLLREKYQIKSDDFLLTSTVGGGGFQDLADRFFEIIFKIHLKIMPHIPNLRHLVIEGPNYLKKLKPLDRMTILKSEAKMASLLSISDLAIAEGGYNTVNEIRLAKTPAIFLPSERNYDDQEERVRRLETKGLAAVFTGGPSVDIANAAGKIIRSKETLKKMSQEYEIDQMPWGNQKAAEILITEGCRVL